MTGILQRVRLELARTPDHPEGNPEHGYNFVAPLDHLGHIDAEAWKKLSGLCRVSRFAGEQIERGVLRHVGKGWRFDYDGKPADDEPFFKLDQHPLLPGNYVSVTEHDGVQRPFKVVSVTPV